VTGLRKRFFIPAFVGLGLSLAFVLAALSPARFPLWIAAFFIVAILCMALLFLRSLSLSLRRLLESVSVALGFGSNSVREVSLFFPETALPVLEKALWDMVGELSRKSEETEAAEAEGRQYLAILNGMPDAVLAVDRNLVLHLANRRACSLFALDEWRDSSLLKATRSTVLEKLAQKVLADGRSREIEFKPRRAVPRGSEQVFRVFAVPLATPDEGVVIIMEDITRLSRLEQVRKDFVANVSHELRTPIQLVKGFSETLLDDPAFYGAPDAPDHPKRFIEIIRRNAVTMENLTNDLLAIASLENSDSSLGEKTRQPLSPLFDEAILSVGPQAEKKEIKLSVDCPDGLEANVHGSLIIQALINLLGNAIKFSPKKSRVQAAAFKEGGKVILEVRDKGIGIPSEHIGRIFERFYRVDRSRSGGTGLGLSIVRHIARLHKGRAEVESHAGEGSVFRIIFPG